MTLGLIKSCKIKNNLFKLHKQNPNNDYIKHMYINYKNKLKYLLKIAKDNYHSNLLNNISNNSKKLWDFVNKKLEQKKSDKPIQQIFSDSKNDFTKDNKEIADIFNNFFTKIGPDMAKKIPRVNDNNGNDDKPTKSMVNSIFLSPTTENEILKIINSLNSNKSAGVDNISCKVLKTIAQY